MPYFLLSPNTWSEYPQRITNIRELERDQKTATFYPRKMRRAALKMFDIAPLEDLMREGSDYHGFLMSERLAAVFSRFAVFPEQGPKWAVSILFRGKTWPFGRFLYRSGERGAAQRLVNFEESRFFSPIHEYLDGRHQRTGSAPESPKTLFEIGATDLETSHLVLNNCAAGLDIIALPQLFGNALAISERVRDALEAGGFSGFSIAPLPGLSFSGTDAIVPLAVFEPNQEPGFATDGLAFECISQKKLGRGGQVFQLKARLLRGQMPENPMFLLTEKLVSCGDGTGEFLTAQILFCEKNGQPDHFLIEVMGDLGLKKGQRLAVRGFDTGPSFGAQKGLVADFCENLGCPNSANLLRERMTNSWVAHLTEAVGADEIHALETHFMGRPAMPPTVDWPRSPDGRALCCIGQLNLGALKKLPGATETDLPPGDGLLLFFMNLYDSENGLTGAEGHFKVLYFDLNEQPEQREFPADAPFFADFKPFLVDFQPYLSLPQTQSAVVQKYGAEREGQFLGSLAEHLETELKHRLPGQIWMQLFGFGSGCQMNTDIYAEQLFSKNRDFPLGEGVVERAAEWRLLLRFTPSVAMPVDHFIGDGDFNFMIRQSDWDALDFSRVQLVASWT